MTVEGIKEGVSMPRNLTIARIFKLLGWVEQFGTGYSRISQACEKHDYDLPEWREIGLYTDIIFKPILTDEMHKTHDQPGTKSALSRYDRILLMLCSEPRPIIALMDKLHWSDRTKFRQRFITPLIEKGWLTMTIPNKPNSRLQKYQTTKQGMEVLAKHQDSP